MVDWTHGANGTTDSEGVIYEGEPPVMSGPSQAE
jgi:hypothetical protein